ncbi:hypothetical protein D3C72_2244720 [compost metagenome]
MPTDSLTAEMQAIVCGRDELADTGGDFGGVGLIGLQCRMNQGITLHAIGHPQAVAKRCHDGQKDKDQNKATQAY